MLNNTGPSNRTRAHLGLFQGYELDSRSEHMVEILARKKLSVHMYRHAFMGRPYARLETMALVN